MKTDISLLSRKYKNKIERGVQIDMEIYEKIYQQYIEEYEINGTELICLCPFHQENTPSFNVNLETGQYYCFGCEEKGNATTFISKKENINGKEAWKRLNNLMTYTLEDYSNEKKLPMDFLHSLRNEKWKKQ